MDKEVDLLQIKIDQAKAKLPPETLAAISRVDWHKVILDLRSEKGYSYEQLGDLETETELLLCGLVSPEDYPRQLQKSMGITRDQLEELMHEINESIFKRIRQELIKDIERKKGPTPKPVAPAAAPAVSTAPQAVSGARTPSPNEIHPQEVEILKAAGIEFHDKPNPIPEVAKPELLGKVMPILTQKLAGPTESKAVQTTHVSTPTQPGGEVAKDYKVDPYREMPE